MLVNVYKTLLLGMATVVFVLPIQADIIHLKSGKSVQGKIVNQSRNSVTIEWVNGGKKAYNKNEISRIKFEAFDLAKEREKLQQKEEARKKEFALEKKRKEQIRIKEAEEKQKRDDERIANERQESIEKAEISKFEKLQVDFQKLQKQSDEKQKILINENEKLIARQKELESKIEILEKSNKNNNLEKEKISKEKAELIALKSKIEEDQKLLNQKASDQEKELQEKKLELEKSHEDKLNREKERLKIEYANKKKKYDSVLDTQDSALWRSAILPGWGQVYKDENIKGYSFMGAWFGLLGLAVNSKSALQAAQTDYDDLTFTYLGIATSNTSLVLYDQMQSTAKQETYIKSARNFNLSVVAMAVFYIYNLYDASQFVDPEVSYENKKWQPVFDFVVVPVTSHSDFSQSSYILEIQNMRMQAEVRMRW